MSTGFIGTRWSTAVNGSESAAGFRRKVLEIPDYCRAEITDSGLSSRCLIRDPTLLTPADLAKPEFKNNWPDPYSGRHWPYARWIP